MAIRFICPACRQPLEIDDAWGGQSVACPYCRRVVTAPQTNTWPAGDVRVASPAHPEGVQGASPGFAPPPPPPGFAPPPPPPGFGQQAGYAPARPRSAGWALTLALAGAAVAIGVGLVWFVMLLGLAMDHAGPNATQAELERAWQEIVAKGQAPRSPGLAGAAVAAVLASAAGLVLGVRSLVRQEPGRGLAIAACVVGALFVFCQLLLMLALVAPRPGG